MLLFDSRPVHAEAGSTRECFESRDLHFNCLDERVSGLEANHRHCPETHGDWLKHCHSSVRRTQMIARYNSKRHEFLFDPKELKTYFRNANK
jgi:hypothetical protein